MTLLDRTRARKDGSMTTYHDNPDLKAEVLAELASHRKADAIVQGRYWEQGKGCAVGCLTHDPEGRHDQYPARWGIPEWLAHLEDAVFEGLDPRDAKLWPERFMGAIPVGVEITDALADRLAVRRLREECLPLAPSWPESVREQVVEAIEQVITALEGDGDRAAAESAAWSAWQSAGRSAANSAAYSTWSARSAARAPARAAYSAGRSAARSPELAWSREADRIIEELTNLGAPA